MRTKIKQYPGKKYGLALVLIVVSLIILAALGGGLLTVAYGVRQRAIAMKNEAVSMLAAEAGYEKAIFWMGQQLDMLSALQQGAAGTSGSIAFQNGYCDYNIELYTFLGYRPVYRVISHGHSGMFNRTVEVLILQAISGWDMGMCRVPIGKTSTYPVHYAAGEMIDIPIHINNLNDSPDKRDIYISGNPRFLQRVAMGESKGNKYPSYIMSLFEGGICFDQPDCRVENEDAVQSKVDRFRDSTKTEYQFTPTATAPIKDPKHKQPAVQLEFFVDGGVGKVQITNNCTVRGYKRKTTWDYKIKPGSDSTKYEKYDIYAYHYIDEDEPIVEYPIEDTYVTQSFGGVESEPGGQIYIDGNVIIGSGSEDYDTMVVKGKITIVATGNIWVADSVVVDGPHDVDGSPDGSGLPSIDNLNALGLIAQGVVKVVDPGMSGYTKGGRNKYPGPPDDDPDGYEYAAVGNEDPYGEDDWDRVLPDPTVIEAAITVGGGGWGAENVRRSSHGGRKESGTQDDLIVRGVLVECCRGVVGLIGSDGYLKHYYYDERFLTGILPADVWLQGKYVPAPAGWHDYRAND